MTRSRSSRAVAPGTAQPRSVSAAPEHTSAAAPHVVAVCVLPGMPLFEVAVPVEVFGTPRPGLVEPPYALRLCAADPATPPTDLAVRTSHGLDGLEGAATVVVPALARWDAELPAALLDALRRAHARGVRVVGLCTGAFALARAGLLDGLTATTHWMYTADLAREHPAVHVDRAVLYAGTAQVMTSAGTASGLDLCLELVRRDHGAAVANSVARRMVLAPHRSGGQAQFVEPAPPTATARAVAPALDWALAHLAEPIGPQEIAAAVHLSVRTLSRQFRDAVGTSPARWLAEQRVRRAQELLEATDLSVAQVAATAGFESAATLRPHFLRVVGTTPQAYRRTFGTTSGTAETDRA